MKVEHADYYSAGDLIELANLIAKCDALKAELDAIKQGSGEPVAWSVTMNGAHTGNVCGDQQEAIDLMNSLNHSFPDDKRAVVPLYTRPCVPLTDDQITAFCNQHAKYQEEGYELSGWYDFARAIEAHIKGAKG